MWERHGWSLEELRRSSSEVRQLFVELINTPTFTVILFGNLKMWVVQNQVGDIDQVWVVQNQVGDIDQEIFMSWKNQGD
jgi:hypothetical protein